MRLLSFALITFAVALLTVMPRTAVASRPDGAPLTPAQIDAVATKLMNAAHVPGLALAIFQKGQVFYIHAYGFRDVEKHLPLTPDSVMTAASLSKAAFATVVMNLVQHRSLSLDKPVYQYLPKPLPEYPRYADLQGDERYKMMIPVKPGTDSARKATGVP